LKGNKNIPPIYPKAMEGSIGSLKTTTPKKPVFNAKYAGFEDFTRKHLVRKGETIDKTKITNTRIGSKDDNIYGGTYIIPQSEYDLFLELYAQDILSKNKKEYFTEKQLEDTGPILVDVDLRHEYDIDERQYTISHVEDLLDHYLDIFKDIFQLDDSSQFKMYVLEKPTVNRVKEKNCTKDGIHIIISLKTDRVTQKMIRNKIIPLACESWGDLPLTNSFEDIFDKGISDGTVNWQLYGSRKPNHDRYKLTHIYDVTYDSCDGEFMRKETPVMSFDIKENIRELSVRNDNHPSLFLKSTFLKEREEFDRTTTLKKTGSSSNLKSIPIMRELPLVEEVNLSSIRNQEELDMVLTNFLESTEQSQFDADLKEAYEYVMILPESYYENGSYTKWIKVGWCLKNISNRLLIVWLAFSARSSIFSFTSIPELCDMWRNFERRINDGITKRSLFHWAKTDAPEDYERIRQSSLNYHVDQSLKIGGKKDDKSGCGDFDLAFVLYQMCKHSYICTSVKNNMWMTYRNHKWHDLDSGTTLRKTISNELRDLYRNKAVQYMHNNDSSKGRTDDNEPIAEQDEINRVLQQRAINITHKLAQTSDKDHIMKEAKELFYDGEFLGKLDTNPYLLCCKNGVYDFKENIFRNGIPEDNISMSTNIKYIPLDETKHGKTINDINKFMAELFPEGELLEYMWDHLASTLLGTSSNQTFNMYIGAGQNGKSVLVNLMEIVLGDYKGDVPLTLVTDRRGKVGGLAPEIVQLKGKRFAVMQEPSKGDVINEGIMKQLTSGKDPIQGRAPYMPQTISFLPQFKLVVTCNVFMGVKSNDHGTWRRIRAVPFKSLFTENPVEGDFEKPYQFLIDKTIDEKFDSWKEVFLSMLIKRACETNGIVNDCDIVLQKSNEYRKSQDYLSEFVNECVLRSGPKSCIQKSELNNEFVRWYEINYGGRGPSPKDLHEYMDRCFGKNKSSKWYGVEIKYEDNENEDEDEIIQNNLKDDISGL
jgi:P4 family phage/plasmid primase-like protien